MPALYARELGTAISAVAEAAVICRSIQSQISAASMEKRDRSPVTVADYASQAIICRRLLEAFPGDPIVAEEDAADLRLPEHTRFCEQALSEIRAGGFTMTSKEMLRWIDSGNHNATADRYWTLDPIDGTKGFLRQDQFAVALALIVEGEIQMAALGCPRLSALDAWENYHGVIFFAVRGGGTKTVPLDLPQATPRPVRVSTTKQASQARMCESFESGHSAHDQSAVVLKQLGITADPVRMDSQAKYGVVARGEADIYLRLPTRGDYIEKIWDHAGGALVVEEAGGRVTDVAGRPLDFSVGPTLKNNRGVLVTNGPLHDEVLRVLSSLKTPWGML